MSGGRAVTVMTHRRPRETAPAVAQLIEAALGAGMTLRFDPGETVKLEPAPSRAVVVDADVIDDVALCVALGGDGTILKALRRYAGTGVPVFGVNFGEVGFLATLEPEELEHDGFERALAGDFEELCLPAIAFENDAVSQIAMNDVSIHRKVGGRVARLAYGVAGEEVGSVRCDGVVICTPAGSTGYNLANGGPVMAWGVEGFAVSFIAPHSLTARALVVAPGDTLTVANRGAGALDVSVDGRPVCELAPGGELHAHFRPDAANLAQLPGSSFYRRLRAKFGRLAS